MVRRLTNCTQLRLENGQHQIEAGEIGGLAKLTSLYLNCSGGSQVTVNQGEIGGLQALTYLVINSGAGITIGAGEIPRAAGMTYLALNGHYAPFAGLTIAEGELASMTNLGECYLTCLPSTVVIGASETAALTKITNLGLIGIPNLAFQTGFDALAKLVGLTYINSLTQAQVDNVLAQLYAGFATRTASNGTINLSNYYSYYANAAPSGVYQAACPPDTGKEYAYELLNDSCDISSKHWSTITVTGGLP